MSLTKRLPKPIACHESCFAGFAPSNRLGSLWRSAEMKFLFTLFLLLGPQCAFAGAIDDVVSKFDRHGLWLNGMFVPITEPETIDANVLAAKILTSYRKSSKELKILEKKDISALKIGISGMKAMHVRVIRTSMYPPPATELPEEWVIVYQFRGGTTAWWCRIYTIEEEKEPNK